MWCNYYFVVSRPQWMTWLSMMFYPQSNESLPLFLWHLKREETVCRTTKEVTLQVLDVGDVLQELLHILSVFEALTEDLHCCHLYCYLLAFVKLAHLFNKEPLGNTWWPGQLVVLKRRHLEKTGQITFKKKRLLSMLELLCQKHAHRTM